MYYTTQLLEVLDTCKCIKWTEILDRGGNIDVVYQDLAKAFDSSPIATEVSLTA